jgi:hypothetical protein
MHALVKLGEIERRDPLSSRVFWGFVCLHPVLTLNLSRVPRLACRV